MVARGRAESEIEVCEVGWTDGWIERKEELNIGQKIVTERT